MGSQELFEFHRDTYRVSEIHQWSQDKARAVLEAWQEAFIKVLLIGGSRSAGVEGNRLGYWA